MSDTYLQSQITEFYQFLFACMVEWNRFRQVEDTSQGEFSKIKPKKKFRSFMDYWSYRLYGNFGLKRRIFKYGDDLGESSTDLEKAFYGGSRHLLMQFFYDKSIPSYGKGKSISQLCRHLVFDINSMSIVSLGITKSIDVEEFKDKLDVGDKVDIEEFLEGTMIIYNPRLALFNKEVQESEKVEEGTETVVEEGTETVVEEGTETVVEEGTETVVEEGNKKVVRCPRRKRHFQISTRRSMGTSYFNNPGFSFQDMWNDTNEVTENDFSSLPLDTWKQYGLVFTLQHPENRIVSPDIEKRNVLVGSYKFRDTEESETKFNAIFSDIGNLGDDGVKSKFETEFLGMVEGMVEVVPVTEMKTQLQDANINVDIPKVLGNVEFVSKEDFDVKVSEFIEKCDQFDIGVILRHSGSGKRSKVRNTDYTELMDLKGSGPITVSDKNKKQLFKVYWKLRQRKDKSIKKFLQIFDNEERVYTNIFDWYKNCIHDLTHKLFVEYLNAFVDKKKERAEIPFEFKPLCGELHKLYMNSREPTTKEKVIQFMNNLPFHQVYWRIFGLDEKKN